MLYFADSLADSESRDAFSTRNNPPRAVATDELRHKLCPPELALPFPQGAHYAFLLDPFTFASFPNRLKGARPMAEISMRETSMRET